MKTVTCALWKGQGDLEKIAVVQVALGLKYKIPSMGLACPWDMWGEGGRKNVYLC